VAVERDVRDPHEVIAARAERLRNHDEHVVLADREVLAGDRRIVADREVAPVDGVHVTS
jgi:hypothetical protein